MDVTTCDEAPSAPDRLRSNWAVSVEIVETPWALETLTPEASPTDPRRACDAAVPAVVVVLLDATICLFITSAVDTRVVCMPIFFPEPGVRS